MNKFECEIEFQDMVIANLRARSGMSYAHLSNIENGKVKHVKLETIQNIAHHLNDIPLYRLISDAVLSLSRHEFLDSLESLAKDKWVSHLEDALDEGLSTTIREIRFPIVGHVRANGQQDESGLERGFLPVQLAPQWHALARKRGHPENRSSVVKEHC